MRTRVAKKPLVTDAATSARMSRVRRHGTKPELEVRAALHRMGLRFRVHNADLPGSPDVANRSRRWVVFVNGCFWHQHPGCRKATIPQRNHDYWRAKLARNVERDHRVQAELQELGYLVCVVWECETRRGLSESLRQRLVGIARSTEGLQS